MWDNLTKMMITPFMSAGQVMKIVCHSGCILTGMTILASKHYSFARFAGGLSSPPTIMFEKINGSAIA